MPSQSPTSPEPLLTVDNLSVHFPITEGGFRRRERGVIKAVDGVSFSLREGETLALVGPPNCGKTTVTRTIALLDHPAGGRILFRGGRQPSQARRQIQMLFSNPYVAFPPRLNVEQVLAEALDPREQAGGQRDKRLAALLRQVGLNLYLAARFPRELSGGSRQRLAVARALATRPLLLLCDQPTQYLEPAVGAEIVDLLEELRQEQGLTLLLTARQLETARHADRVAIMMQGRIVEMGTRADLLREPLHPFTQALLEPQEFTGLSVRDFLEAAGRSLDPLQPAAGCRYAPLCRFVEPPCHSSYPAFIEGAPNHGVACHLVEPL